MSIVKRKKKSKGDTRQSEQLRNWLNKSKNTKCMPPVSFKVFSQLVENLPDIAFQIQAAGSAKPNSTLDECAEWFYNQFYKNSAIREKYEIKVRSCPLGIRNKLLQLPIAEEATTTATATETEIGVDVAVKNSGRFQFPVSFATFKQYINKQRLIDDLLRRKTDQERQLVLGDSKKLGDLLRKGYNIFYMFPHRRRLNKYEFEKASPEILELLLKPGVPLDEAAAKTVSESPSSKSQKNKARAIQLQKSLTSIVSFDVFEKFIKNIYEIVWHLKLNDFKDEGFENCAKAYYIAFYLTPEIRERIHYEFVPCTSSMRNRLLALPSEADRAILLEMQKMSLEIATSQELELNVISPPVEQLQIVDTPEVYYEVQVPYNEDAAESNAIPKEANPVTFKLFKRYIKNLDGIVSEMLGCDEYKGKTKDECALEYFKAFYTTSQIRTKFKPELNPCPSKIRAKLLALPAEEELIVDVVDIDSDLPNEGNPPKVLTVAHDKDNVIDLPSELNLVKIKGINYTYPVDIKTFLRYVNYDELKKQLVDAHAKTKKIGDETNEKQLFKRFYYSFYLDKSLRKKFNYNFNAAPAHQRSKFTEMAVAITEKHGEELPHQVANTEPSTSTQICAQEQPILEPSNCKSKEITCSDCELDVILDVGKSGRFQFPVSFESFKRCINYDELLHPLLLHVTQQCHEEARFIAETDPKRCHNVFTRYYRSFYVRPIVRRQYAYKFESVSAALKSKLMQYAVPLNARARKEMNIAAITGAPKACAAVIEERTTETEVDEIVEITEINEENGASFGNEIATGGKNNSVVAPNEASNVSGEIPSMQISEEVIILNSEDTDVSFQSTPLIVEASTTVEKTSSAYGILNNKAMIDSENTHTFAIGEKTASGKCEEELPQQVANTEPSTSTTQICEQKLPILECSDCELNAIEDIGKSGRFLYPVSFETFKRCINYDELLHPLLLHVTQQCHEEARFIAETDPKQCHNVFTRFYHLFYVRPIVRRQYDYRFESVSAELKSKLMQCAVPLNESARRTINMATYNDVAANGTAKECAAVIEERTPKEVIILSSEDTDISFQSTPLMVETSATVEKTSDTSDSSSIPACEIEKVKNTTKTGTDKLDIEIVHESAIVESTATVVVTPTKENMALSGIEKKMPHHEYEGSLSTTLPVSFRIFKKYIKNLDAIVQQMLKCDDHSDHSEDECAFQYFTAFYLEPAVREKYEFQIKPCPAKLREKILSIPVLEHESEQGAELQLGVEAEQETNESPADLLDINSNSQQSNDSEPFVVSQKIIITLKNMVYEFPVALQTFKQFINYEALKLELVKTYTKDQPKSNVESILNDERIKLSLFRRFYHSFYIDPRVRKLFKYNFNAAPVEFRPKLLEYAVPLVRAKSPIKAKKIATVELPQKEKDLEVALDLFLDFNDSSEINAESAQVSEQEQRCLSVDTETIAQRKDAELPASQGAAQSLNMESMPAKRAYDVLQRNVSDVFSTSISPPSTQCSIMSTPGTSEWSASSAVVASPPEKDSALCSLESMSPLVQSSSSAKSKTGNLSLSHTSSDATSSEVLQQQLESQLQTPDALSATSEIEVRSSNNSTVINNDKTDAAAEPQATQLILEQEDELGSNTSESYGAENRYSHSFEYLYPVSFYIFSRLLQLDDVVKQMQKEPEYAKLSANACKRIYYDAFYCTPAIRKKFVCSFRPCSIQMRRIVYEIPRFPHVADHPYNRSFVSECESLEDIYEDRSAELEILEKQNVVEYIPHNLTYYIAHRTMNLRTRALLEKHFIIDRRAKQKAEELAANAKRSAANPQTIAKSGNNTIPMVEIFPSSISNTKQPFLATTAVAAPLESATVPAGVTLRKANKQTIANIKIEAKDSTEIAEAANNSEFNIVDVKEAIFDVDKYIDDVDCSTETVSNQHQNTIPAPEILEKVVTVKIAGRTTERATREVAIATVVDNSTRIVKDTTTNAGESNKDKVSGIVTATKVKIGSTLDAANDLFSNSRESTTTTATGGTSEVVLKNESSSNSVPETLPSLTAITKEVVAASESSSKSVTETIPGSTTATSEVVATNESSSKSVTETIPSSRAATKEAVDASESSSKSVTETTAATSEVVAASESSSKSFTETIPSLTAATKEVVNASESSSKSVTETIPGSTAATSEVVATNESSSKSVTETIPNLTAATSKIVAGNESSSKSVTEIIPSSRAATKEVVDASESSSKSVTETIPGSTAATSEMVAPNESSSKSVPNTIPSSTATTSEVNNASYTSATKALETVSEATKANAPQAIAATDAARDATKMTPTAVLSESSSSWQLKESNMAVAKPTEETTVAPTTFNLNSIDFFAPIGKEHNLKYLIYTSHGLKQTVWCILSQLTCSEFKKYTCIHNGESFYKDESLFSRVYSHVIHEGNWPINLYVKLPLLIELLRKKDVQIDELDLAYLSPKILHSSELMRYTNFDDIAKRNYRNRTGDRINNLVDLFSEVENFYIECWMQDQWILQVPRITYKDLKLENATIEPVAFNIPECRIPTCLLEKVSEAVIEIESETIELDDNSLQDILQESDCPATQLEQSIAGNSLFVDVADVNPETQLPETQSDPLMETSIEMPASTVQIKQEPVRLLTNMRFTIDSSQSQEVECETISPEEQIINLDEDDERIAAELSCFAIVPPKDKSPPLSFLNANLSKCEFDDLLKDVSLSPELQLQITNQLMSLETSQIEVATSPTEESQVPVADVPPAATATAVAVAAPASPVRSVTTRKHSRAFKSTLPSKRPRLMADNVPQLRHGFRPLPLTAAAPNQAAMNPRAQQELPTTSSSQEQPQSQQDSFDPPMTASQELATDNTLMASSQLQHLLDAPHVNVRQVNELPMAVDCVSDKNDRTSLSMPQPVLHQHIVFSTLQRFMYFESLTTSQIAKYQINSLSVGSLHQQALISVKGQLFNVNGPLLENLFPHLTSSLLQDLQQLLNNVSEFNYNCRLNLHQDPKEDLRLRVLYAFMRASPPFTHIRLQFENATREWATFSTTNERDRDLLRRKPKCDVRDSLKPEILQRMKEVKSLCYF